MYLPGTEYDDTIEGTSGRDILKGLDGNDFLSGYGGNDRLDGGFGADTMRGGGGNDTYVVDSPYDVIIDGANSGVDTVVSSISMVLHANMEVLILSGYENLTAEGNKRANRIHGNTADNLLIGRGGNDTIYGGIGDDTLIGVRLDRGFGRLEIDQLTGGKGADLFVLGNKNTGFYGNSDHDNRGRRDYAFITDFTPWDGDRLQLNGEREDYFLGDKSVLPGGSVRSLYRDSNQNDKLDSTDELIAVIQGTSLTPRNILRDARYVDA